VRADGSMLDPDQVKGPNEQWVDYARGKLAGEGVPMTADGRVDMAAATRMPIPKGIEPARPAKRQVAAPEPCWKHDKVQYSCRDCMA
jgi:hypothetical protein